MPKTKIEIVKSTGEKARFSFDKLKASLRKSGAGEHIVEAIVEKIKQELYPGISTKEIYNRAYSLLRKERGVYASRYKLKKALFELGPTGFPFERFVSHILRHSGYKTRVSEIVQGHCVSHEVDVLAEKNGQVVMVECKFHSDASKKCNVKVPLYIHSRYTDIKTRWNGDGKKLPLSAGWVVTNTQFTKDAIDYGRCSGLYLLSWDYPGNEALRDRIDRLGLYPLTVTQLLTAKEKGYLLKRDIVLLKELHKDHFLLDHLGISEERKKRILHEVQALCNL
jgi:hypothetical protein